MSRIFDPPRNSPRSLGPLESRLLEAIWERRSATVRELIDACCRDLAYTTVMTTLDRLYKKNLLNRTEDGRAFRYAARYSREDLDRQAAGNAFRQMLDSSPSSHLPLSFLVEILSERDTQLLDDLRKLVERKRRELSRECSSRDSGNGESVNNKEND